MSVAEGIPPETNYPEPMPRNPSRLVPCTFVLGMVAMTLVGSYLILLLAAPQPLPPRDRSLAEWLDVVNPSSGYVVTVAVSDLGPELVRAGVVDVDRFRNALLRAGDMPEEALFRVLTEGSEETSLTLTAENAHFWLNFFWAVGLANQNPILETGPLAQGGRFMGYASTGGWTLAARPVQELYASLPLIHLTSEQQARLVRVARAIHRPCCDNNTLFPDCNHGMALLGLMELMASQGASEAMMLETARWFNAYWFPMQAVEQAIYFERLREQNWEEVDPAVLVSWEYASASGFETLHAFLLAKGWLPQEALDGASCAE